MNGISDRILVLKSNIFKEECPIGKYVIITTPNCPNCKMAKTLIKGKPYENEVEFVSVETERGIDLANKYDIQVAGYFIIDTETDEVTRVVDFVQACDKK